MLPIFRHPALLLVLLAAPLPALAQGFENLEMLDNRVAAALGANIGEPGGATTPIDRRLRLQACPQPVEIGEPVAGALAVRCVPLGWRIRVSIVGAPQASYAATAPARAQARPEPVVRRGDQIELVAIAQGFTVSTLAVLPKRTMPTRSLRGSYGSAAPVAGTIWFCSVMMPTVWPSLALAIASIAITPAPPGLFSTTSGCPSELLSFSWR